MRILKFGGTSVGSAERMKKVAELIASDEKTIVVLSAMSGTTNSLVEFANCLHQKKSDVATDLLLGLHEKYKQTVAELFSTEEYKQIGLELLSSHLIQNISKSIKSFTHKYDVVGPICESSDCFGKAIMLPETNRGDLIAIRSAGAYGEVMSSAYNLRDRAKAFYSSDLK